MKLAKLFRNLTACSLSLWLIGCSNQTETTSTDFNRSEAVKARVNLAVAYLEQNDFPKAKENIDKALIHDPSDYLPYSVLAYYYQQIGDTLNATQTYQKAIEFSQSQNKDKLARPDVLNNYGAFLCKQGKFDQAYQQFDLALKSSLPYYHQADTLENIILCAHQAKNVDKKIEALQNLEKLDEERAKNLKGILIN
ncbi:type IV pilus biogenesis/stability protein PilW [Pasteurellaceae bacterium LFhippo2]|nr:type IV pilus biogenesis/stability protein PilW [Pasteurellaceae bacterium LFhippo2]